MSAPDSEDVGTDDQSKKPPRSLRAIFDEIETKLIGNMRQMGLALPKTGYGAKHLKRYSSPPRIVCVPDRGSNGGTLNRHGNGVTSAWALWGRNVVLQFHVWDKDDTETEVLANHLVAAIHDQCAGLYEPVGEQWLPSEDTAFGNELVLGVRFYTIWSREFIPAVQATSMSIDGQIDQPSS